MDSRLAKRPLPFPLYILDEEREPIVADKSAWDAFHARGPAIVAETKVGGTQFVTSFVGVDLSLGADDAPALFQTCVTISDEGEEQFHSFTWEEAESEHREIIAEHHRLARETAELEALSAEGERSGADADGCELQC